MCDPILPFSLDCPLQQGFHRLGVDQEADQGTLKSSVASETPDSALLQFEVSQGPSSTRGRSQEEGSVLKAAL